MPSSVIDDLDPRLATRRRWRATFLIACLVVPSVAISATWDLARGRNDDLPGENVTVTQNGSLVARLIFGDSQQIPYLALYDEQERRLTNAGLDSSGQRVGLEPHQRGIFIGWARVRSELGVSNLWALNKGDSMRLVAVEELSCDAHHATIAARIEWRAAVKDVAGSDLLLTEGRRWKISRAGRATKVDVFSRMIPARDLKLDGDAHHGGVHLRLAQSVAEHQGEVSYLWSPQVDPLPGKVVSRELQWGEFLFPLHGRWYSALLLNAPTNPVEELSTREYGRFGFFFNQELRQHEPFEIHYRFIVREAEAPAQRPKRSPAQLVQVRHEADLAYVQLVRDRQPKGESVSSKQ